MRCTEGLFLSDFVEQIVSILLAVLPNIDMSCLLL